MIQVFSIIILLILISISLVKLYLEKNNNKINEMESIETAVNIQARSLY